MVITCAWPCFLLLLVLIFEKFSETTIDYQARQHEIDFILTPYTKSKKLSFEDAQKTLKLSYQKTTLMFERNGVKTSGLDGLAVRPAQSEYPQVANADPEMPIPSSNYSHLSIDVEGLVAAADGRFGHFFLLPRSS